MRNASSAYATWSEPRSASEYTATEPAPSSRRVRKMRTAISPRLATKTLSNIGGPYCPGCEPRGPVDRRACALRPHRRRALRVAVPQPRLLGDRRVLRRDDDRLVRRTARATAWADVA